VSENPVTAAEVMSGPVVAVTTDHGLAAAAPAAACDDDRHG
jgi:hypothetical protein